MTLWSWSFALILCGLFLWSTWSGGLTWDEEIHFDTVSNQWAFARNVLFGPGDETFRHLPYNEAFYGIGTLLPARLLSYLIDSTWFGQKNTFDKSFSLILHLTAFVSAVAASWYTARLVDLATDQYERSALPALALLVVPVWIGYGFFDYKDMPVAAGLIGSVYYATAFMTDRNPQMLAIFFAALLFLGPKKQRQSLSPYLPASVLLDGGGAGAFPPISGSLFGAGCRLSNVALPHYAPQLAGALGVPSHLLGIHGPVSVGRLHAHCWRVYRTPPREWSGLLLLKLFSSLVCRSAAHSLADRTVVAIVLYIRSFRTANLPKHVIAASLIWPIAVLAIGDFDPL